MPVIIKFDDAHIGQRKLLLNEIQFLTELLLQMVVSEEVSPPSEDGAMDISTAFEKTWVQFPFVTPTRYFVVLVSGGVA